MLQKAELFLGNFLVGVEDFSGVDGAVMHVDNRRFSQRECCQNFLFSVLREEPRSGSELLWYRPRSPRNCKR